MVNKKGREGGREKGRKKEGKNVLIGPIECRTIT